MGEDPGRYGIKKGTTDGETGELGLQSKHGAITNEPYTGTSALSYRMIHTTFKNNKITHSAH